MSETNKKNVLVLGATGLLGHHCFERFKRLGFNTLGTYLSHKIEKEGYVSLDASNSEDLDQILKDFRPDIIINTIAHVTVDGCEENPDLAKRLNRDFVQDIVELCKKYNLEDSHLVQISSDSVYGNKINRGAWKEDDPKSPLSVYAATKLDGEEEALKHKGPSTVLRTAFYGINPFSKKSLLWWIIYQAENKVPMDGWENIYFCPVSIQTLTSLIIDLVANGSTGIFNVGSIDTCNKFDFIDEVCRSLKLDAILNRTTQTVLSTKQIRPNDTTLDCTKLKSVTDWNINWRDDLKYYLQNMPEFPK